MTSFDEEIVKDDEVSSLEKKLQAAFKDGLIEYATDKDGIPQLTFTEKGVEWFQKRLVDDARRIND